MIDIRDKKDCCACSACVNVCPKQCITFVEDTEGFNYPKVDLELCIDCGLCEKVCPVINKNEPRLPLEVLAAKNRDEAKRKDSSSGGVFVALAEYVISKGGEVYGASFDENCDVVHTKADTIDGIKAQMGSKYMQSQMGNIFKTAQQSLKEGKLVLFTGTPCQISGFRKFLRRDYSNLITADIVCHGVPSAKLWHAYLQEKVKDLNPKQIDSVSFRSKDGFSWRDYGIVVKDHSQGGERVALSEEKAKCQYMRALIYDVSLRPSCFACPSKGGSSLSDITLGDFWGIKSLDPAFDDDKGVSFVTINTEKGREIVDSLDLDYIQGDISKIKDYNKTYLCGHTFRRNRTRFFKALSKGKSFSDTANKYATKRFSQKAKFYIDIVKNKVVKRN